MSNGFEFTLTEQQRQVLNEVKTSLFAQGFRADIEHFGPTQDRFLLRFLRATMKDKHGARVFSFAHAEQRLIKSLEFRRKYGLQQMWDDVRTKAPPPANWSRFQAIYPALDIVNPETGKYCRFAKFGRFVSKVNVDEFTIEEWIKLISYDALNIEHELELVSKRHGKEISTYVFIGDMSDISLFQVTRRTKFMQMMSDLAADNFPECMERTLFVNCPWIFPKIYSLVAPLLDPFVVAKFQVYNAPFPLERLTNNEEEEEQLLPKELVPLEYGGLNPAVVNSIL